MKKSLKILLGIILILVVGICLSKNYIMKKVLEDKFTQLNKGKVNIGKLELSLLDKKIIMNDIQVTSRRNGMKNFISIGRFETDYDIYFKDKKILMSRSLFNDVEFMTDRRDNGDIGYLVEKPTQVIINREENLEEKKDSSVRDLEELIQARSHINDISLKNILKAQYSEVESLLKERENYWKEKLEKLEKTPEYAILVENYNKISDEKNPLKLIRMEKEIKNMISAFKILNKELMADKKQMKEDFKSIAKLDGMNNELEQVVNELVNRGEFVITDLDSIVNYYLNEIYGEEIKKMVIKYRSIMSELELRRDEDIKAENKWEFFAEDIIINSKIYGIRLKGEIKNISSRISKNTTNVELFLNADSDISHGEAFGYIDFMNLQGEATINISNFNFNDLKDMQILNKYVITGEAGLNKKILLSKENIDIQGDVKIKNMHLNGEEIVSKLHIESPFLKVMIDPILKDVNSGNIHYEYNSLREKLFVKSDLSQEIMKVLNAKDGAVKKRIVADMMKKGEEEIRNYKNSLDEDNRNTLEELEENIDKKTKYLNKVQDILEKFNLGSILDNF